jgi:hypothetical protein
MPSLLPSEIVKAIDSLFGLSRNELEPQAIKHIHQVQVRTLLSLLDDLPRDLIQLPASELVEFTSCRAVLAAAVGRWTFGDTLPSPAIGGKDPVERIRRLLQQCPDELPPLAPELPFIDDNDLRLGIEDRIRAAWTDFKAQEWIGSTMLAGTALEALLLWKVKQFDATSPPSAGQKRKRSFDEMYLAELITEAEERALINSDTASQARLAKDARNLVHPGRAARSGTECSKATALIAFAAVYRIVDAFSV